MSASRRHFLKQLSAGGALLSVDAHTDAKTTSARRPPNLLLVFPDEMRAQAQQFMRRDPVLTPRIDRFAAQSCVLPQAISNYPLCTPARAMIMTGQYPIRNGMTGNCHDYGALVGIDLSRHAQCWSDVLKTQGYALGYIGKWHLDAPHAPYVDSYNNPPNGAKWNEWTPPERRHGFDFWYAYGTYDRHLTPMYWSNQSSREQPLHVQQWGPEHEADMAIRYLRNEGRRYRDPARPFALVVSMNPPHSPYDQVPQRYLDLYAGASSRQLNPGPHVDWDKRYEDGYGPEHARSYMAMVSGVDEQFGRILDALDETGLSGDTLVVFCSDHGCCLGAHGEPTKNNHYEESLRIPMMFRLPGKIAPRSDELLMSLPDLYPTMLGLLGLGAHIPATVEGGDWSARVLSGKGQGPGSQLYLQVPYGGQPFGKRGVRTERYTLVIERQDNQPLRHTLHDNLNDPWQQTNLAEREPAVVARLIEQELLPWLERTGDPWRPAPFATAAAKRTAAACEQPASP